MKLAENCFLSTENEAKDRYASGVGETMKRHWDPNGYVQEKWNVMRNAMCSVAKSIY